MTTTPATPAPDDLARENDELRHRLREAEELIAAVRTGAVDALAIQGPEGPRIFTLQGADESYRTLIEQMNEGALLLSPEGTVLYANAALAGLLGQPLAALLGSAFAAFVPLDFQGYWAGLLARGWAGKARGELPLQSPGGPLRPFAVSMNEMLFNGAPALAVLVTDLSAQQEISDIRALVAEQNALLGRANEELLRQQAARQAVEQAAAEARRVLEGIPQIAWTATPAGVNTYLNRRWFDYTGQAWPAPADRPVTRLIHPDDHAAALAHLRHSLATGEPLDAEFRIRNAAGYYRWMLGRALPSRDAQGTIVQWIGTFTDIHEQRLALEREAQARAELRANNEQLTRVNEDLDNFVYTASHDLKGPITNLEGLVQALAAELPAAAWAGDQVPPILAMMQDSVDRFKRTIESLAAIIEVQKEAALAPEPAAVDVRAVIADVCLDLAPQLQAAGGRLDVAAEGCPPVPLAEKNLRSVVYNLLSNAIKYRAPERPLRICLACRAVADEIVLAVRDNGLGLDLADEERLFAMFQRLHDHVEGSGIGLYMVKKLVENAGGRVEVQSQLGVGSTFSVHFRR
ncbi:ATP-binding protein [Hymenobacter caeli]|uniref:histidine kinase n=1 Tax=Hymenobacter caeli TaxID=2735894 RepID=A0ABX2FS73_9BACT|nr:PAS domain-containing sensor histidine kinase [Hymenobacter caeli]NRT20037.1 PAS domain S-box-containing protein [Hymenobacter caeli]